MSNYLEFDPSFVDTRVVYRLLTGSLVATSDPLSFDSERQLLISRRSASSLS